MAVWILRASWRNDLTGTHVARWLNVPPRVVLAGLSTWVWWAYRVYKNCCCPLLTSHCFGVISETQTKAIHHCQNAMPTSYTDQSPSIDKGLQICYIPIFKLNFFYRPDRWISFKWWFHENYGDSETDLGFLRPNPLNWDGWSRRGFRLKTLGSDD